MIRPIVRCIDAVDRCSLPCVGAVDYGSSEERSRPERFWLLPYETVLAKEARDDPCVIWENL